LVLGGDGFELLGKLSANELADFENIFAIMFLAVKRELEAEKRREREAAANSGRNRPIVAGLFGVREIDPPKRAVHSDKDCPQCGYHGVQRLTWANCAAGNADSNGSRGDY